jgi:hypothetical protein
MGLYLGRGARRALKSCLLLVLLSLLAAGCGATGPSARRQAGADPPGTVGASAECSRIVLATLGGVAERVYREATDGRIAAQATLRLQRSKALIAAVEHDSPTVAHHVLRRLLESQIVRVSVARDGRVLATVGKHDAIAPVRAPLLNADGRSVGELVLSVIGANGYAQTTHGLIGAEVLVLAARHPLASTMAAEPSRAMLATTGSVTYHGTSYVLASFNAQSFSAATLRIVLLVPVSSLSTCGATRAQTTAETLGRVSMRIYADEQDGERVTAIVRHVERSRAFRDAVLSDNPVATRAAIVGFFRTHLHVVRVRALLGNHLVTDLGGPYALAPVAGAVRNAHGRVVGRFLLAVQDDMGYLHLAYNFTGAQVLMRIGPRQVMGTLTPGPTTIPNDGAISYGGVNYQAFSFTGTAFPSGTLRISLLMPLS